jgi:hypothetical protein
MRRLRIWASLCLVMVLVGLAGCAVVYWGRHTAMRTRNVGAVDSSSGQQLLITCVVDHSVDGIDDWTWTWSLGAVGSMDPSANWQVEWNVPFVDYASLAHGLPLVVSSKGYNNYTLYLTDASPKVIIVKLDKSAK